MKELWGVTKITPVEAIQKSTLDRGIKFKEREGRLEGVLSISNRISYKNLMRNKRTLLFTAITMTIGCSLYLVGSFQGEMFDRDREYYNAIYKGKNYEFTLNVNESIPMKQAYSLQQVRELKKSSLVEDVLARGVLYSRIEFPTKSLNGSFGQNYLRKMEKKDKILRAQTEIPIEGKSGFSFQGQDKEYTLIRSTLLGLSQEELKPLKNSLSPGKLPSSSKDELQALLYLPKVTEKGTFYGPPGEITYEPILNLKVGDKIKLTYPQKGYEQLVENYSLIMDYERYRDFYVSREVVITGIVDELPVEDNFHLGFGNLPYLLIREEDFKELTGIEGYRILSIDMKDNVSEKEYQELRKRVQQLAKAIPGTNLIDEVEQQKSINRLGRQTKTLRNTIAGILIFISGLSIYNNISYNLLSHLRKYGILKAVGLTTKQFKSMIQFEGLTYGTISAFFACSISFAIQLGLFLFHAYISSYPLYHKQFFLDWKPYILIIAINLAIGYLATLGPISQVNRLEITEAIRTVE